jgi:hypothetical protein
MSDISIREQLLAAITTAVGGEYSIPAPEDERDLPVTIVQDGTDEALAGYGYCAWVTPVAIATAQAAIDTRAMSSTEAREALREQAHAMLAALHEALHADPTFGALADGFDDVSQGIQTEIGKFVFAELQIRVRWHHVRGNPFLIDDL